MTLKGKIALITGATKGLGAAIAERFAKEGADLILVGRNVGALEAMDDRLKSYGGSITLVPHDLSDTAAIDQLAEAVASRFGRLDILVGNAALLGQLGPIHHTVPAEWDRVIAVNLTANWRLMRAFDPLLRAAPAGRVVFVGDEVADSPTPYWSSYAVSKAGLETLMRLYAQENTHTPLRINMVDPGPLRTDLRTTAMPGEDPHTLTLPSLATDPFVYLASSDCLETGQVILHAA